MEVVWYEALMHAQLTGDVHACLLNSADKSQSVQSKMPKPTTLAHLKYCFQNRLQILALCVNADNAFIYDLRKQKCESLPNDVFSKRLNFNVLKAYLCNLPAKLLVLQNEIADANVATDHQLIVQLLVDENSQPQAFVGTQIAIPNSVKNNQLTNHQKRLVKLVMDEFSSDLLLTKQAQSLQAILSQHLQISALNQDLICIKDGGHRLVYANPALLKTFPESAKNKILGLDSSHYYEPETRAQIADSDLTTFTRGYFKGNEYITLANGEEKILLTTKKSFVGVDGKKYLMSVSRDITEKEILINDLKRSNGDLDNFAYVASHDLRAPLNAIKRLVSWVKEDCDSVLPQESKEDLAIVLSRVARMEKLLVDLLSYSRIGKEYQEATEINLREFVIQLLSLIDLPMGFVFNCDDIVIKVPEIPFNVVMLNLVSNAIKHHDSGNAKIEIKAKRNERGCVVSVLDNGPGVEEKNRDRIFKLFETLKSRDEVEGSGMGLSVVKKIVEHYGGSVKVDANLPRGTKFIVNWPINNIARAVLDNLND